MKKLIETKKISALILASLLAGSMLLCSCNSNAGATTEPAEAITETTTEATEATTTAPRWETTAATQNPKETTPYQKITLDGSPESTFVSTDFCYIESEKYVLLLDRDIKLPGDFVVNVDAIIDEIEKQLGVSYAPDTFKYDTIMDWSSYYDKKDEKGNVINPWQDWDIGSKIPIFLVVDRDDIGLISCADNAFTIIRDNAMFSDELWDSIPSYKDNAWRRGTGVDYGTITHELTHTIAWRNCDQTDILSEGLAQYMEFSVLNALSADHPTLIKYQEDRSFDEGYMPERVNEKTAERIFVDDYHSLSHANRGAEYDYGQRFWQYLFGNYGDDCFVKFKNKVGVNKMKYNSAEYNEDTVKEFAGIFKELYGDDIFSKFGTWCVKNKYLQKTNG